MTDTPISNELPRTSKPVIPGCSPSAPKRVGATSLVTLRYADYCAMSDEQIQEEVDKLNSEYLAALTDDELTALLESNGKR